MATMQFSKALIQCEVGNGINTLFWSNPLAIRLLHCRVGVIPGHSIVKQAVAPTDSGFITQW
jgi:hypothetical protein